MLNTISISPCLTPIDQTLVPSQFDHFVPFALQDLPNGIDRLLGIELLQKIKSADFLAEKILLRLYGDANFQFHLETFLPAPGKHR